MFEGVEIERYIFMTYIYGMKSINVSINIWYPVHKQLPNAICKKDDLK